MSRIINLNFKILVKIFDLKNNIEQKKLNSFNI